MASSILERIRTRTKVLPEGLREHLFRVEEVATEVAMLHGVEVERARVAALAHDLARAITGEELLLRAQQLGLAIHPVEERVPILLHGPVAAESLRLEEGLDDRRSTRRSTGTARVINTLAFWVK